MQTMWNRWIGSAAVRAAALGVALLGAGGARGQSAPYHRLPIERKAEA